MVLLSIIIPVYKTEKYLRECVDSVLREAPQNSEIILVDDGSPDNCPQICDEYAKKDERVKVIHQQNKGLSGARNAAMKIVQGEKLFFLDSDDFVGEGYFSALLNKSADLVIGNYRAFYDNGTVDILGEPHKEKYESLKEYLEDFHYHFATLLNFAWGKIYDSRIIKQFDLRFLEGVSMVEDVLFNLEYYRHCSSIVMCKEAQLQYRQVQGSLSRKMSLQVFDWYVQSYGQIKKLLVENDAFSKENEAHFYSHFIGNAIECIVGILPYGKQVYQKKYQEIINNDITQTAIEYYKPTKTKGIVKGIKLKSVKILEKQVKKYVFKLKIKRFLRGLYGSLFKS